MIRHIEAITDYANGVWSKPLCNATPIKTAEDLAGAVAHAIRMANLQHLFNRMVRQRAYVVLFSEEDQAILRSYVEFYYGKSI